MQRHIRILDPVSWMLLFSEAYSQMASFFFFSHTFSLMGIKLAHCLSHLFSELLVGVFENAKHVAITFSI